MQRLGWEAGQALLAAEAFVLLGFGAERVACQRPWIKEVPLDGGGAGSLGDRRAGPPVGLECSQDSAV